MTTELSTIDNQSSALADVRSRAMLAPVAAMQQGLAEYTERRQVFRDWILQQMKAGTHYGTPPGCEPKLRQSDGYVGVYNYKKKEMQWYPPEQWKPKPSLYKAGAEFVVDLMGLRPEYSSDELTWSMAGKPSDTFFRVCKLFSRATGEIVGSGTGARLNGAKGMDVNASIKMADKSAMVAAVINAYGLSDLFTQDIEDEERAPNPRPEQKTDAPRQAPRAERVTSEQLKELVAAWKDAFAAPGEPEAGMKAKFGLWVAETTNGHIAGPDALKVGSWDRDAFVFCMQQMGVGDGN